MSLELSLYAIETVLLDLITLREEMLESSEDVAAVDEQITAYIRQEVVKVDNIRAFWKHCELMRDAAKEEARVQSDRSKAWGARLDRLKATCALVMESIPFPAGKPRKLEGRTGALYLKGNGGKQAVEVTDESLVPDEFCIVTVTMREGLWERTLAWLERSNTLLARDLAATAKLERTPSLFLIGEALGKPCGVCAGDPNSIFADPCPECGGSGHQSVPGCRLSPRSNHVEVR